MPLTDKTAKSKILYIQTVISETRMFVELVYDKRNVEGLEGASGSFCGQATYTGAQIFPDAEVRLAKPMRANCLNSDTNKTSRKFEQIAY